MSPDWVAALAAAAAVIVSILALWASLKRANQDAVKAAIQKANDDNEALQTQVRALELDVAKNYLTRAQMEEQMNAVANRLERSVNDLASKIEDLNRWLRRPQP